MSADTPPRLLDALGPDMLLLADRNFGDRPTITAVAGTGADLLIRVKAGRHLPVCARCGDGSWITRIGVLEIRVIRCALTITTTAGQRREIYQLVTTVRDAPATELVDLYHQRWEIETTYLELKSTILGGRVLRARTPAGIEQEIYALLVTYQALRIAIADVTLRAPDVDPDRGSFTVALNAARDQVITAAAVLADAALDRRGAIGQQVLDNLLPRRRNRTSPRVVKRAISKFAAPAASGRFHGPAHTAAISLQILDAADP